MTRSLVSGALLAGVLLACDLSQLGQSADDDGGASGNCGSANCTSTQVCLYRECSASDRCVVATSCSSDQTPSVCPNGQAGCLVSSCTPVVQGCRDVPASCSNDVTCACQNICGSAAACAKTDGRNIDCAAQ